ncbi:uncharacterized protein FIBRA_03307 [Fibroporia radiculosa]|uniref:Elongin-C n=1 Tax=Fibroporia radiculosa TaxID=599839 RepID=J4G4Z1_9APHY|nr:uncharacterized protein FIBRA_03307 [Fibroporia radiculosa]CCM01258.1 predicted protein [Fibroporia radiculosa]
MAQVNEETSSESDWVKLVSTDGYSYLVRRKVAMGSATLRNMLNADNKFLEALSNTCVINERGVIVEKLCEYLSYKALYENTPAKEVPDFTERLQPEIALEMCAFPLSFFSLAHNGQESHADSPQRKGPVRRGLFARKLRGASDPVALNSLPFCVLSALFLEAGWMPGQSLFP